MREIVVISGKGGTGKTSLTASFAVLSGAGVIADCDVDAADMHLLLAPESMERHRFVSGNTALISESDCIGCGQCSSLCRFGAITRTGAAYAVDPRACEGCCVCVEFCPSGAISFPERDCGEWMVSMTRAGVMVHARLSPGAENSGKLVSLVRREAKRIAEARGGLPVITDGPPGIGCPVIASVTGASLLLAVTEPTLSGAHDLERVMALAAHFGIPVSVCVNKWDINPEETCRIEKAAASAGAALAGNVRYDPGFTQAMISGRTIVETGSPAALDVREVWRALCNTGG